MPAINALTYMHAAGDGGPRTRTTCVVIHATDNTAGAAAEAGYATHRPDKTSAHFYIDDTTAIRALPLDNIAYGCLYHGNQISVQLELCGPSNHLSDATIRRAAGIAAEICRTYNLPIQKITAGQVRNGAKGICGHGDITAAFPEDHGDHTDPGAAFPWPTFINYIQAAANNANPGGDTMATLEGPQALQLQNSEAILSAIRDDKPTVTGLNNGTSIVTAPNALHAHLVAIDTALANLTKQVTDIAAAIKATNTSTGK